MFTDGALALALDFDDVETASEPAPRQPENRVNANLDTAADCDGPKVLQFPYWRLEKHDDVRQIASAPCLDPTTGQFLTIDPMVSQTMQPYAYTGGDPVNKTDPSGRWSLLSLLAAVVAVVIAVVVYIVVRAVFVLTHTAPSGTSNPAAVAAAAQQAAAAAARAAVAAWNKVVNQAISSFNASQQQAVSKAQAGRTNSGESLPSWPTTESDGLKWYPPTGANRETITDTCGYSCSNPPEAPGFNEGDYHSASMIQSFQFNPSARSVGPAQFPDVAFHGSFITPDGYASSKTGSNWDSHAGAYTSWGDLEYLDGLSNHEVWHFHIWVKPTGYWAETASAEFVDPNMVGDCGTLCG